MQLTRAVDRYTAALGFSPTPAPSGFQLLNYAPAESMGKLSPDSVPSGLGDLEGFMDAVRAATRAGAMMPRAAAAVRPGAVAMLPGLGRKARSQYANVLKQGLGGRVTKFGNIGRIMPSMRPRVSQGAVQGVAGGIRAMTGISRNLGDLEDFWDDLKSAGGAAGGYLSGKVDELDKALKIIIGLSGVAAITGIITVLRK